LVVLLLVMLWFVLVNVAVHYTQAIQQQYEMEQFRDKLDRDLERDVVESIRQQQMRKHQ
jgi:hypothetical protein